MYIVCSNRGSIKNCALLIEPNSIYDKTVLTDDDSGGKYNNNIALRANGESDPNGAKGRSVSQGQIGKGLFEVSLGWDFVNVWDWDENTETPVLRVASEHAPHVKENVAEEIEDDDLAEKLQANIWL